MREKLCLVLIQSQAVVPIPMVIGLQTYSYLFLLIDMDKGIPFRAYFLMRYVI